MNLYMLQEQAGEQFGTLERSSAITPRAHRVGDSEGYRAHWTGSHRWRCCLSAKTTGKPKNQHFLLYITVRCEIRERDKK